MKTIRRGISLDSCSARETQEAVICAHPLFGVSHESPHPRLVLSFTFHAFRNTDDPRDVVITDRRQNPTLPTGSRWTFYATFASPLKAAVAFGVRDIKQLRQQVHSHGYHRVRIEPSLRRA